MRLEKLSDGSVRLSQLSPWDLATFRSLPSLADYSDHPGAERRLLPPPAVEQDFTPEMGMDWVEHVVPELRDSFAHNLGIVMADLEKIEAESLGKKSSPDPAPGGEDRDGGENSDEKEGQGEEDTTSSGSKFSPEVTGTKPAAPSYSKPQETFAFNIPADHTEHWFRAMNQARIVLSAKHGIDSEHQPDLANLLASGHLEHWFQYELFVSLQGWLVEVVLDPG